ncbi:MAG: 50S ribosomal protein L24 [Candidatus Omnitrophota bacterium]
MMEKIRFKKGDVVQVITGDDLGKTGKILRINRKKGRLVVQGVNMQKKHQKKDPQSNRPGGIIEREGSIHPSNVRLVK